MLNLCYNHIRFMLDSRTIIFYTLSYFIVRQPGSERAIKVGFCSTHQPEKNFYHGWADISWVIKIQPVVQFQGGAVPRKPLRKTGIRNTKNVVKLQAHFLFKIVSYLQNSVAIDKSEVFLKVSILSSNGE